MKSLVPWRFRQRQRTNGRQRSRRDRAGYRRDLRFEPLESRRLLATVIWNGSGDATSWSDPLNWDRDDGGVISNSVPQTGDDVTIPDVVGTSVVHMDSTALDVTLNSLTSDELFQVSGTAGGTFPKVPILTLEGSGPFSFNVGLDMSGGVMAGAGNVAVGDGVGTDTFHWTGGVMFGSGTTTINPSVTAGQIDGGAFLLPTLGRTMEIAGTVDFVGGTMQIGYSDFPLPVTYSGTLTILDGGTLTSATGGVFSSGAVGGNSINVESGGTLQKSGAGTTLTMGLGGRVLFPFNNHGTVDLQAGVIQVGSNYVQTATGELRIGVVGGPDVPGVGYARLVILGGTALDGTLAIQQGPGLDALVENGDIFSIAPGSATHLRSGEFASVTGAIISPSKAFFVNYNPIGFILIVNEESQPIAVSDSLTVDEGATATTLDGGAASVLDNDFDSDPTDAIHVTRVVSGPSFGVLTLNADGTFSYAHNGSEIFSDFFVYEIADDGGATNTATVTIAVNPVNDNAPVAIDDALYVGNGGSVSVLTSGLDSVLLNDTDTDLPHDALTATLESGPSHAAAITVNPDGTFSYTHDGSATYADSFQYRVTDAAGHFAIGTVAIVVNDAPLAAPDAFHTDKRSTLTVAAPGVLSNDADPDAIDSLHVSAVHQFIGTVGSQFTLPSGALLTLNADGSFTYDPNGQFDHLAFGESDVDSFTYTASDGRGGTHETTVEITVVNSLLERSDLALASTDVSFSPTNPAPGETVTVSATIRNYGLSDAGPFVVRFESVLGGGVFGEISVAGLAAGASTTVSADTSFAIEGFNLVSVVADPTSTLLPTGEISETNEANNEAALVVQVGQPAATDAVINVTAADVVAVEGHVVSALVSAFYDFASIPGPHDFPVQGGLINVEVIHPLTTTLLAEFTGANTTVLGDGSQAMIAPLVDGAYTLRVTVTDASLTGQDVATLTVVDGAPPPIVLPPPDGPPPPPPIDAEDGVWGDEGGSGASAGYGGGGYGGPGAPDNNVYVYSEHIFFTNSNPDLEEPLQVFASVNFFGSDDPVAPFPVTFNTLFPVAGELRRYTAGTTQAHFAAGESSSPRWVVFPWIPTVEGAQILQIDTDPPAAKNSTVLDDAATRMIQVGPSPEELLLEVDSTGLLLVDADVDGVVSPGDTLQFTHFALNNRSETLDATLIDYHDSSLGAVVPGSITGGGDSADSDTIVWALDEMLPGESRTVTYRFLVDPSIVEDTILATTALLSASPAVFDATRVVIHVNDPPSADDATFALDENDASGTAVGAVVGTDPDDASTLNGTLSYAITAGDPGGLFAIDNSGNVSTTAPLDHETTEQHVLTVEVTDGRGASAAATVTINVNDLNETPTADDATFAVDENQPAGTAVGTVSANDPDDDGTPFGTLRYAITAGDPGGLFAIDGAGHISTNAPLDHEADDQHVLTVTVADGGGLSDSATVTINVNADGGEPTPIDATIDVQPGIGFNLINVSRNASIPIAVFTTADFNAANVDVGTVVFAEAHAVFSTLSDVDGDGDQDLLLFFRTQDTNLDDVYREQLIDDFMADGDLDSLSQDVEVTLTGETLGGQQFEGVDTVNLWSLRIALEVLFGS